MNQINPRRQLTNIYTIVLIINLLNKNSATIDISQFQNTRAAGDLYKMHLNKLADLFGIEEKLTSYVSLNSFASNADGLGIPLTTIIQKLAHKSVKTTQIYLASLNDSALDEYNEEILEL